MRILVTGGAGFIGSHTCDELLKQNHKVMCLDNFNDYYNSDFKEENIAHNLNNPNFKLIRADITNYASLEQIFKQHSPEKIIHLAARAGVRPSIEDPFIYEQTNVRGTLNLLELAKKKKELIQEKEPQNVTNALFVGSTADLQKMIQGKSS